MVEKLKIVNMSDNEFSKVERVSDLTLRLAKLAKNCKLLDEISMIDIYYLGAKFRGFSDDEADEVVDDEQIQDFLDAGNEILHLAGMSVLLGILQNVDGSGLYSIKQIEDV